MEPESQGSTCSPGMCWIYEFCILEVRVKKGTSLVAQWLRFHAPNAGGPSLICGQGIRPHILQLKVPLACMCDLSPRCIWLLWPHGLQPTRLLSVHEDSPGQEYRSQLPCSGDLPNLGIEPRSPALQMDSLSAELPGKPKDSTYCNKDGRSHN